MQVLVPPRYQIPSVLVPPGYQNTERLREQIAREVVSFPSRCWGLGTRLDKGTVFKVMIVFT